MPDITRYPTDRAFASTLEELDYVDGDGVLHMGITPRRVMVSSADDLEDLPEDVYPPGSEAFTADGTGKWRKGIDGEWESLTEEETAEETPTEET